ncbi:MAG: shikimate kinase [Planctomycetota bacterium]
MPQTPSNYKIELDRHVFLIGYRGTGKTTVGRRLARRLRVQGYDLDEEVERVTGVTIREIFAQEQEAGFRKRERDALMDLITKPPTIISLGGGAILKPENRDDIRRGGKSVWLRCEFNALCKRLRLNASPSDRRPRLTDLSPREEVRRLLEFREPLYREVADLEVDTSAGDLDATVRAILDWLKT